MTPKPGTLSSHLAGSHPLPAVKVRKKLNRLHPQLGCSRGSWFARSTEVLRTLSLSVGISQPGRQMQGRQGLVLRGTHRHRHSTYTSRQAGGAPRSLMMAGGRLPPLPALAPRP